MSHWSRNQFNVMMEQVVGAQMPGQIPQGIFESSTTQRYKLGSRMILNNGGLTRVFYYGRLHPLSVGAGARGRILMSSSVGAERGAKLGAQVAGAYTVNWVVSVGAITLNQFANGFILIQGGFVREIMGNTACLLGGTSTLYLYDPLPESIAAGRYGLLQENPYSALYAKGSAGVNPNAEGCVMGCTTYDAADGRYIWAQTLGPCGVICNNTGLGDAAAEFDIRHGMNPGDEVTVPAGHGYQHIGNLLIANAVDWDNENFIIVDLKIRP